MTFIPAHLGEETKAQRGKGSSSRSHSKLVAGASVLLDSRYAQFSVISLL